VIVVCANVRRTEKRYGKRGSELYVIQDTAAAAQNIHLMAYALGYATCWVGAFDDEKVAKVIQPPEEIRPLAIIPVGEPAEKPKAPSRRELDEITHENIFPQQLNKTEDSLSEIFKFGIPLNSQEISLPNLDRSSPRIPALNHRFWKLG